MPGPQRVTENFNLSAPVKSGRLISDQASIIWWQEHFFTLLNHPLQDLLNVLMSEASKTKHDSLIYICPPTIMESTELQGKFKVGKSPGLPVHGIFLSLWADEVSQMNGTKAQ